MPVFIANYTNRQGETKEVHVTAASMALAKRDLRRSGKIATSIVPQPTNSKPTKAKAPRTDLGQSLSKMLEKRPGVRDKALFSNKMAALIDAGVPIVRSLEMLASQQTQPLFKRALTAICIEVNQGTTLGSAMRRWPMVFDRLMVSMVEAGEAGGVLDETLRRLAKLQEDVAKLQNQIKGALGYPVAVLFIAIAVFLGMTIFIIPQFADIFKSLGAELPAFTQMLVDLSGFLRSPEYMLPIIAVIALAVFLFSRYYATPVGRMGVDRVLLKIPLFGDLILKSATAQFCRTYSALSRAGVPILQALEILKQTSGNAAVQEALDRARNDVQEGISLSKSLLSKQIFPDMALSMLAIGEETGEMDAMLSKVADFYEEEVGLIVKNLTAMLEPAMIVLVGGIVGAILVAMYLPMFSVFQNIS
ncbi:MAG: type II secretion system F family protein [Synechococcales cyanobacterium SupBloom_Metag_052]|nr:type II secretion system F family protein [Synechococcales cyanobacterium SupBloom_Metag_052]